MMILRSSIVGEQECGRFAYPQANLLPAFPLRL